MIWFEIYNRAQIENIVIRDHTCISICLFEEITHWKNNEMKIFNVLSVGMWQGKTYFKLNLQAYDVLAWKTDEFKFSLESLLPCKMLKMQTSLLSQKV